jgi:hypothetical protein
MYRPIGQALGALEYGKFRKNRQGESVVAVANEGEVLVKTILVTASGLTEVLAAPTDEYGLRIRGFQVSMVSGSAVNVSLRQSTDGDDCFTTHLESAGNSFGRDFNNVWALETHKSLNVNTSGVCSVYVTVSYEEFPSRTEGLKLTDSMAMAETRSHGVEKTDFADSITMTEEISEVTWVAEIEEDDAVTMTEEIDTTYVEG